MKQSLLLYLFILALVFNVFTYAYYSKEVAFQKGQLEKLAKKSKANEVKWSDNLIDANYFSLENNEKAQNYFYSDVPEKNVDYATLIPLLKENLNSIIIIICALLTLVYTFQSKEKKKSTSNNPSIE